MEKLKCIEKNCPIHLIRTGYILAVYLFSQFTYSFFVLLWLLLLLLLCKIVLLTYWIWWIFYFYSIGKLSKLSAISFFLFYLSYTYSWNLYLFRKLFSEIFFSVSGLGSASGFSCGFQYQNCILYIEDTHQILFRCANSFKSYY